MRLRGCWSSSIVKVPLDSEFHPSVLPSGVDSLSKHFLGFSVCQARCWGCRGEWNTEPVFREAEREKTKRIQGDHSS